MGVGIYPWVRAVPEPEPEMGLEGLVCSSVLSLRFTTSCRSICSFSMHLLGLPAELWEAIAEFVLSDALGQACRQLKAALGSKRYASLVCDSRTTAARLEILKEKLRTLQLWAIESWNASQMVSVLRGAPNLRLLVIGSLRMDLRADGVQPLGGLREVPSLHTLTLFLGGNTVGLHGAQGLAALKDSPSLQCLTLDLTGVEQGCRFALLLVLALELEWGMQGQGWVCGWADEPASCLLWSGVAHTLHLLLPLASTAWLVYL